MTREQGGGMAGDASSGVNQGPGAQWNAGLTGRRPLLAPSFLETANALGLCGS